MSMGAALIWSAAAFALLASVFDAQLLGGIAALGLSWLLPRLGTRTLLIFDRTKDRIEINRINLLVHDHYRRRLSDLRSIDMAEEPKGHHALVLNFDSAPGRIRYVPLPPDAQPQDTGPMIDKARAWLATPSLT
ncbi:MAG: hypothetical protein AAF871_00690 [Pseudomonadota bacterium]